MSAKVAPGWPPSLASHTPRSGGRAGGRRLPALHPHDVQQCPASGRIAIDGTDIHAVSCRRCDGRSPWCSRTRPILILDEATSALDNATETRIQQALGPLTAGRTTLVIAHRLSTFRDADQILVLHHGRLVEQRRFDELVALGGHFAPLVRSRQLITTTHPEENEP